MTILECPHHPALHLSTQDYGWNDRRHSLEHEKRFKQLTRLHELTLEWIETLRMERAPYLLERGLTPSAVQNLWMLDSLSEKNLTDLLDDTSPEDVLDRLDYTIWAAQAYTLSHILDQTPPQERESLSNSLEQMAWRAGRRASETQWKGLSPSIRSDLPSLVMSCMDHPFSFPGSVGALVRRCIRSEVQLELLDCAHQKPYLEIQPVAGPLCSIHSHWIRGYAYGLNQRTAMEFKPGNPSEGRRCEQRWSLITNPSS